MKKNIIRAHVTKHFNKMKDAERYQNYLYTHHDHVILVRFPRFSEAGTYTWEVR